MKKIYFNVLFLALLATIPAHAQLTLTKAANEPSLGDNVLWQGYDSTTAIPKSTGAGQSWNFTSLSVNTSSQSVTYTTAASTPSAALFPSATIAAVEISAGNTQYEYYHTTASTFEYDGSYKTSPVQTTTFSNPGTLYKWPVSIASTNTDAIVATQTSTTNTASINGIVSYTAAGSGTVIMPNGNTLTNCLQVVQVVSITVQSGTNTTNLIMEEYDYFSSSVKLPVLTVKYNTQTTGTVVSKSCNINVNNTALTVGMSEHNLSSSDIIVYPNPASNTLWITLPGNATASSVEIIDVTGKVVAKQMNSNAVNISSLPKAAYFARVKYENNVIQKPFVVSE
jgi:hypothetical protein